MLVGIDASRAVTTQRTGTEGYAYFLLRALVAPAQARGHRLRLYTRAPGALPQAAHVEQVVLPFPRLWTHFRLAWELRRHPTDVFFTPAHVIPYTYRGPAVATVHDLGYRYFPRAHTRFQAAYLRWSTRHNVRRSRCVIADSRATRDDLVRLYGVPAAKITVVYPGVDPSLAPVTAREQLMDAWKRYGISPPYLLYLGTLQPRKNIERLLDAYAASGVPHQLVLAGKAGWLAAPIAAKIDALPPAIAGRVRVTGFVADVDKAALLSGATALLYPSLYEGFGFPVLEAQACATAVLCADNSSLPEVGGEGALLVPAEDSAAIAAGIRRLVQDEALRRQLVAAGRMNVRRFTWEAAARQVLTVLEMVAGARAPEQG